MPLIITPKQLNQRAELYHQLGIMTTAGLSIHKALEHLQSNPPSLALRAPITQLLANLDQGYTVSESVRMIDKWLPTFDVALIEASERSGRLDFCFKIMAVYYRERAQMVRQMISDMAYPVFILHFAVLIFSFVSFMKPTGTWSHFIFTMLAVLAPIYVVAFLIIYACQGRHGMSWRGTIENILGRVPILGTARQDLALARLSLALESLLNAGVPIVSAWELAATASGSPALDLTVQGWKMPLQDGASPSELVSQSDRFPQLFANLYHTGEVSGTTDQTLTRLHTLYQTEGLAKMKALSAWTPKILYIGILLVVAWKIVSFWQGYYGEVNKAMSGF